MLNLLEENIGNTLYNIGTGMDFLNSILFALELRAAVGKEGLVELKSLCEVKENTQYSKLLRMGANLCQLYT